MRLVLASKSPARAATLRNAGLHADQVDSGVDESVVSGLPPSEMVTQLARLKAEVVADQIEATESTIVVGCDSLLELDGKQCGKPRSADQVIKQWYWMRGRQGVLHTGHHVVVLGAAEPRRATRLGSTTVQFGYLTDSEIAAYAATGEPQRVAGAFTIDGLGGAFITSVEGDPHNVAGLSLPLLRQMLLDLGVEWHTLWTPRQ